MGLAAGGEETVFDVKDGEVVSHGRKNSRGDRGNLAQKGKKEGDKILFIAVEHILK